MAATTAVSLLATMAAETVAAVAVAAAVAAAETVAAVAAVAAAAAVAAVAAAGGENGNNPGTPEEIDVHHIRPRGWLIWIRYSLPVDDSKLDAAIEKIPASFEAYQGKVFRITIRDKNRDIIPDSEITAFAKTGHPAPNDSNKTIHGIQFSVPITQGNGPDNYKDQITISVEGLVPGNTVTIELTAKFEIKPGVDDIPVITATNTTYQLEPIPNN